MTLPEKSEALKVLGENIRRIRQEKNISMQKLAHIADIELSQIYRIETGKVNPRFTSLLVIARALEVSLSDLFKTTE